MGTRAEHTESSFRGIALSGGSTLGRAWVHPIGATAELAAPIWLPAGKEMECARFLRAVQRAISELEQVVDNVKQRVGSAESLIFRVQQAILRDSALIDQVIDKIEEEGLAAEAATVDVLSFVEARIGELDDAYIRERGSDLAEVRRRLLEALRADAESGQMAEQLPPAVAAKGQVLVVDELTPSMTVDVDPERIVAIVSEQGGMTSHATILARAVGIPAVSGLRGICARIPRGAEVLVDGDSGQVTLWPGEETLAKFHHLQRKAVRMAVAQDPVAGLAVLANISQSTDVEDAVAMKAEGIGLYRTEFEFLAAGRILTEDEQYERYRLVLDAMDGKPIYFRLLDIGGDKAADFLDLTKEDNPYLGHRGSRLLLDRSDLLRPQARALARASVHGTVHVMYPMVTELEQFERLKWLFCEGIANTPKGEIRHGVMLEVPAACLQARELLAAADFGSIGTNDLIQYLFAVDRNNDLVAYDYSPDKPIFWWMIGHIVQAARETGRPLSVCGEVASRPRFLPRLLELGINTVSVSPRLIPGLRSCLREQLSRG